MPKTKSREDRSNVSERPSPREHRPEDAKPAKPERETPPAPEAPSGPTDQRGTDPELDLDAQEFKSEAETDSDTEPNTLDERMSEVDREKKMSLLNQILRSGKIANPEQASQVQEAIREQNRKQDN